MCWSLVLSRWWAPSCRPQSGSGLSSPQTGPSTHGKKREKIPLKIIFEISLSINHFSQFFILIDRPAAINRKWKRPRIYMSNQVELEILFLTFAILPGTTRSTVACRPSTSAPWTTGSAGRRPTCRWRGTDRWGSPNQARVGFPGLTRNISFVGRSFHPADHQEATGELQLAPQEQRHLRRWQSLHQVPGSTAVLVYLITPTEPTKM